ncbi:transmembrane amino acid transporter protein [Besnoitia besnoiti]|uniref:Transmembrane amino acid transporter protein n=1 Tax=Besnoitia besnoiti TaxID=94643 RepID=A0A2A9MCV0_BESBE|nr:transmembrane amino acid transporter protein [Besnoitia besnoiti]PFH35044.1 transmembrane amino acid transporter protein [Besnoitia besnoiti]
MSSSAVKLGGGEAECQSPGPRGTAQLQSNLAVDREFRGNELPCLSASTVTAFVSMSGPAMSWWALFQYGGRRKADASYELAGTSGSTNGGDVEVGACKTQPEVESAGGVTMSGKSASYESLDPLRIPDTSNRRGRGADESTCLESGSILDSLSHTIPEKKKSGFWWTGVIILKSFIGGGFLFLPHVFMRGGLILSFITFFLGFAMALYCMILLVRCCKPGLVECYEDIAELTYGPWGGRAVEVCIVASQLSFSTVNMVVVAGNLRDVIWTASDCDPNFEIPTRVLLWAGALIYVPLCLLTRMRQLAPVALVANIGTGVGIIMLLAAVGVELGSKKEIAQVTFCDWQSFPLVLGTVIYMWEGTGLVLPIRHNAKRHVQEHFSQVLSVCLGALLVTYSSYVLFTNFTFGTLLEAVILSNLPANGLGLTVQAIFALAVMATVPLMMFPASEIVESRVLSRFQCSTPPSAAVASSALRTCLVILTLAVATGGLHQIDNFVALIGGVCGAPLTFVFPTLLYLKLFPDEPILWRVFHYAIVVGGVGVQVFSLYWAIKSWSGTEEFVARCTA